MSKNKKTGEIKPLKNRFLRSEKPENLYVTFALYFVMIFMGCLLIFVYLVGMCRVQKSSMNPTLYDGDHLLMLKNPSSFVVGDIITFRAEVDGEEETLIKRVIGVGGDKIVFVERSAGETDIVDIYRKKAGDTKFELMREDYLDGDDPMLKSKVLKPDNKNPGKFAGNVVAWNATEEEREKSALLVDEGRLLVLGDNRNDSIDSRYFGLISADAVSGKMFYRLTKGSILERLLLLIYNKDVI